jgi:hypothetical protein
MRLESRLPPIDTHDAPGAAPDTLDYPQRGRTGTANSASPRPRSPSELRTETGVSSVQSSSFTASVDYSQSHRCRRGSAAASASSNKLLQYELPEFTCLNSVNPMPDADGYYDCHWKLVHVPEAFARVVGLVHAPKLS